jgi:hypothetical protein
MSQILDTLSVDNGKIMIDLTCKDGFYYVIVTELGKQIYMERHLYLDPAQNDFRAQYYRYQK